MKFSAIAFALSVVLTSPALAGPGDPRLIQGALEWPPALSGGEPFLVMRGDDGRVYYADVMAAQRHVQGALSAGDWAAANRMCDLFHRGEIPLYCYVFDAHWGRACVRLRSYLPFEVTLQLNGHDYLERQMHRQRRQITMASNAARGTPRDAGTVVPPRQADGSIRV